MTEEPQKVDHRAPVDTGWHLKKEVNISLIISVFGIAVACVTGYTDLKRDIALIQADMVVMHTKELSLETADDKNMTLMRTMIERMDAKLDRLIERGDK